jgi:ribose transport system ATP-binding protein
MANAAAITLAGIGKVYGPVAALNDVGLTVLPGEVHALMGENGAGKSTLLKILSGVVRPDSGTLTVLGEPVDFARYSPGGARDLGVAIVHQEFSLIPSLTVAENIFLGQEKSRGGVLREAEMTSRARQLLDRVHASVSPATRVESLTVAQSQLVEIAKALASDVKVIALDEPSAVLSGEELRGLFDVVRSLAASGVAVLYVSHRIDEVFELCSRYSVLKDGRNSGSGAIADTDADTLISLMVGRSLSHMFPPAGIEPGEPALQARDLEVLGLPRPVSLTLRGGEIVGLAGLQGAGRSRLARALFGDVPVLGGSLTISGAGEVRHGSPRDAMRRRIAYLPEDRKGMGLALDKPVSMHVSMLAWRRLRTRVGSISRTGERSLVDRAIDALAIKTAKGGAAPVRTLSGGNQQKVVLAKWLELLPDVVIFDEPTRGIDVGSKEQIYALLRGLADEGKAILVISSELIEVLGLSDRILVMADGEIVGEIPGAGATEEAVMQLITSHSKHGKGAAA